MSAARVTRGRLTRAIVFEQPDRSLQPLLEREGFDVTWVDETPDTAGVCDLLEAHRPHLLFKRSRLEVDAAVLDAAPDLVAVMLCCIGDDSVDKQAAADRGVLVLNDPRSNGRSVAELVLGQLVMGARRIPEDWAATRQGRWGKSSVGRFELRGKTLGILGLGNIGKQVARLAESMGMDILFYDTDEVACGVGAAMEWARARSVRDLFAGSDLLTVHLSAEDHRGRSNEGLIGRDLLFALGADRPAPCPRVFVNAGRGFLLDPADLLAAVDQGHVGQAFVDVFPEEPQAGQKVWANPFQGQLRIHATPHIGAATEDAQPRIAQKMARAAMLLSHQGTVEDCVFSPGLSIGVADQASSNYLLAVVHSDARGTKKAVDDAIYRAGVSNLQSAHRDFARYGIAYDLSVLDRPLAPAQIDDLIAEACALTGRADAVRSVRQIELD